MNPLEGYLKLAKLAAIGALVVLTIAAIFLAPIWHRHEVRAALQAADAAGYARAQGEDKIALAAERQKRADLQAQTAATVKGVINAYHAKLRADQATLADARGQFDSLSLCDGSAGAAARPGAPVPAPGASAGGTHDSVSVGGRVVPSLAVVGEELSRCEVESDRGNALQSWVKAHE